VRTPSSATKLSVPYFYDRDVSPGIFTTEGKLAILQVAEELPKAVILSASAVILSAAKDLRISLRVYCAKDLGI